MPKITSNFYCQSAANTESYITETYSPNAKIDIKSLAKGKLRYIVKAIGLSEPTPKAIVLNDPTLFSNGSTAQNLKNILSVLLEEGFPVYYRNERGKYLRLTSAVIPPGIEFSTVKNHTAVEELVQQQPDLCGEQILCFDYFERRKFEKESANFVLDVNEFSLLDEATQQKILAAYDGKPITLHCRFDNPADDKLLSLLPKFLGIFQVEMIDVDITNNYPSDKTEQIFNFLQQDNIRKNKIKMLWKNRQAYYSKLLPKFLELTNCVGLVFNFGLDSFTIGEVNNEQVSALVRSLPQSKNLTELRLPNIDPSSLVSILPQLANLTIVQFSVCSLRETDFTMFKDCKDLQILDLSNSISSAKSLRSLISVLPQLPKLVQLRLPTVDYSGDDSKKIDFSALKDCKNLQILDMSLCHLTNDSVDSFASIASQLVNLVSLRLPCDGINYYFNFSALKDCKNLQILNLHNSRLTKESINSLYPILSQLPKLTELRLSDNDLGGSDLNELGKGENLQILNLRSCRLTKKSLAGLISILPQLPKLTELYLYGNDLEGIDLGALKECKNLQILDLGYCKLTKESSAGLISVLPQLPKLTKLRLTNSDLEGINLSALKDCKNLQILDLRSCKLTKKSSADLISILPQLPKLTKLRLANNDLREIDLSALKDCKNLQKLDLGNCHLTINQLNELFSTLSELTNLTELSLRENDNLAKVDLNEFWNIIRNNCKNIQKIGLPITVLSISQLALLSQIQAKFPSVIFQGLDSFLRPRLNFQNCTTTGIAEIPGTSYPAVTSRVYSSAPEYGYKIDRDTKNKFDTLNAVRYFPAYHPVYYRLKVVKRDANGQYNYETIKPSSPKDKVPEVSSKNSKGCALGYVTLRVGEWSILPSLSAQEELRALSFFESGVDYELAEDKENHFYLIKPKADAFSTVQCKFALNVPANFPHKIFSLAYKFPSVKTAVINELEKATKADLSSFIDKLVNLSESASLKNGKSQAYEVVRLLDAFFNDFPSFFPEDLPQATYASDDAALWAMMQNRTGACRHRSEAFLMCADELKKRGIDLKAAIQQNDVHENVMVSLEGEGGLRIDLGGYISFVKSTPAVTQKEKAKDTKSQKAKPDTVQKVVPPQPISSAQNAAEDILALKKTEKEKTSDVKQQKAKPDTMQKVVAPPQPIPTAQNSAEDILALKKATAAKLAELRKIPEVKFQDLSEKLKLALSKDEGNKIMLIVDSDEERERLFLHVQSMLGDCYPVFSPAQLSMEEDVQIREGKKSAISGALASFLTDKEQPILFIDWDAFNQRERLQSQSVYDNETPKVGQDQIPKNSLIIGISTEKKLGNDASFLERAGTKIKITEIPPVEEQQKCAECAEGNTCIFNMYEEAFCEAMLVGDIYRKPNGYEFIPGALAVCCERNISRLILVNSPDKKTPAGRKLRRFCEIIKRRGKVWYNGEEHKLPQGFSFEYRQEPYQLQRHNITVKQVYPSSAELFVADHYLINQASFDNLFANTNCENGKPSTISGWLKFNAEMPVKLVITEELNKGQWAKLLDYAEKGNCKLEIYAYPGITLPKEFNVTSLEKCTNVPELNAHIIVTNDVERAAKEIDHSLLSIIRPITKYTSYSELIQNPHKEEDSNGEPLIYMDDMPILAALKEGKTVILTAEQISPALYRQLESMLIKNVYIENGKEIKFSGKLLLVTKEHKFIDSNLARHITFAAETKYALNVHHMPETEDAEIFAQNRIDAVEDLLRQDSPIICISGGPATGKSYFMQHILPTQSKLQVAQKIHFGFENIASWLRDGGTLFIDDADREDPGKLAELISVYGRPPMFRGVKLGAEHKIVFVLKSAKDGFGKVPDYIKQYGAPIVELSEAPNSYLIKNHLANVWDSIPKIKEKIESCGLSIAEINATLLEIYKKSSAINNDMVSRNLQQMLLYFAASVNKYQSTLTTRDDYLSLLLYAANLEVKWHLSEDNYREYFQNLSQEWQKKIGETGALREQELAGIGKQFKHFVYGKCHNSTLETLEMQSALGELRNKCPGLSNNFGTCGINIEGESGSGKSRLVKRYCRYKKLISGTKHQEETAEQKFIQFNPSNIDECEKTLAEAFHKGWWLIIDEGNSLPMEQLVSGYLQGVDKNGKPPEKKRFCVIFTGNSAANAGRVGAAASFRTKCDSVKLKLDQGTVRKILEGKGVAGEKITELLEIYKYQKDHMNMTPRELWEMAKPFENAVPKPTPWEIGHFGEAKQATSESYEGELLARKVLMSVARLAVNLPDSPLEGWRHRNLQCRQLS